jgi:hypothetical protein
MRKASGDVEKELCGLWSLTSWRSLSRSGVQSFPFGQDAHGSLCYAAGSSPEENRNERMVGRMSAQLSVRERHFFTAAPESPERTREKSAAFDSYVAYAGRWWLDGELVIHFVEMSLYPNWIGTELVRRLELRGDELILSTLPNSRDGVSHHLSWRRIAS